MRGAAQAQTSKVRLTVECNVGGERARRRDWRRTRRLGSTAATSAAGRLAQPRLLIASTRILVTKRSGWQPCGMQDRMIGQVTSIVEGLYGWVWRHSAYDAGLLS